MTENLNWSVGVLPVTNRDVRDRIFYFGSVSVRFLKKTLIWFAMSLVQFGLNSYVRFGYYSYLLLM